MINKKLIDAEKLKLAIRDDTEIDGRNYARMKMHINEANVVDAVEVVRCKDCTHYDNDKCICNFHSEEPQIYATFSVDMTPDDFCSYGERKDK